ncbi:hypothetical protein [Butyrivibrio sp. WCE2006]|uniref:hypothetical protein n=1 Tax=Butyrivibrio sp. WCE2006 TaxID=1410611 RepID=UPI001A9A5771
MASVSALQRESISVIINIEDVKLVSLETKHLTGDNEQHALGLPLVKRKENPGYVTTE